VVAIPAEMAARVDAVVIMLPDLPGSSRLSHGLRAGIASARLEEAAVIAERAGLDLRVLYDLFGGGHEASRVLETRGRRSTSATLVPRAT